MGFRNHANRWKARKCLAVAAALGSICLAVHAGCPPGAPSCIGEELLADLTGWAVRLSSLPAPPSGHAPGFTVMHAAELQRRVCGEQSTDCRRVAAYYDSEERRVLYLDTLDMRDPTDQSFIVHELVHFLQHLVAGQGFGGTCEAVILSERQAYAVQNRYLERFRQWRRVGEMSALMDCGAGAVSGEPLVRFEGFVAPRDRPGG